ncbi:MAG: hypothetical protein FWD11_05485 [Micrococcales bacterium]|nr:hypothetical protein [Micrococcales bacterium]
MAPLATFRPSPGTTAGTGSSQATLLEPGPGVLGGSGGIWEAFGWRPRSGADGPEGVWPASCAW